MAAKSNPKGIETKMDSSTLRSHLEEENYSSAPESPTEHNQRENSPSPPPQSYRFARENPAENNQREKFSPPSLLPPRSYSPAYENPAENNQREKFTPPSLLPPRSYGSAYENPVENNQREKSSLPPPSPPRSYGSAHESLPENNQREKSSPPNPPRRSYGSAHDSPVENNQRERSSPPLPPRSYGSTHENPAENNQRERFSPPLPPISKAIVTSDRYSHDHGSFPLLPAKELPPPETQPQPQPQPQPQQRNMGVKPGSPMVVVNRSMREELAVVTKVDPGGGGDGFGTGHGHGVEDGVLERVERRSRAVPSILKRAKREAMVKKSALVIRVCAVVFCLVSFSVMGADKTRGWAGDSFDRYKEYRYCMTVNILGFVYAGFQMFDTAYHLNTGKHLIYHPFRYHLDFALDQMMTYLLISASSSAATRVDDWVSNWGKDEFTEMASASISMSFLAFFSFAISSLISGYHLCTFNFT